MQSARASQHKRMFSAIFLKTKEQGGLDKAESTLSFLQTSGLQKQSVREKFKPRV